MMKNHSYKKSIVWSVCLVLVGISLGCEQPKTAEPTEEAPTPAKAVPDEKEVAKPESEPAPAKPPGLHGKMPGYGKHKISLASIIHEATADLSLTDEQNAKITALHEAAPKPTGKACPYKAAKTAFHSALAKGVASGDLDEASFEKPIADLVAVKGDKYKTNAKMLADLHGILTPEQRKKAVDLANKKLEALGSTKGECPYAKAREETGGCPHAKAREEAGGCPHAKAREEAGGCPHAKAREEAGGCPHAKAHGEGCGCPHCKKGEGGECPCAAAKGGETGCPCKGKGKHPCPFMGKKGPRLMALVEDLALSDDQKKKVEALKEKITASHTDDRKAKWDKKIAYWTTLLEAFEKETLDNTVFEQDPPMLANKSERLKNKVADMKALTEILDEKQRKALAVKLEKRAEHMGPGRGYHAHH